VLVVSSESEELAALAHRVVVMRERRLVAEMAAGEIDEARILIAASGGQPD
jgi:ABC-type sugar transport system ATPase subunit